MADQVSARTCGRGCAFDGENVYMVDYILLAQGPGAEGLFDEKNDVIPKVLWFSFLQCIALVLWNSRGGEDQREK